VLADIPILVLRCASLIRESSVDFNLVDLVFVVDLAGALLFFFAAIYLSPTSADQDTGYSGLIISFQLLASVLISYCASSVDLSMYALANANREPVT
jgi:hypothetical protein